MSRLARINHNATMIGVAILWKSNLATLILWTSECLSLSADTFPSLGLIEDFVEAMEREETSPNSCESATRNSNVIDNLNTDILSMG